MVSCCVFYYIWLHQQFVRRHERDMMAEQRIQIMMTQIQPHFLYNTLSTIQVLCVVDPPQAAEITGKFSVYLRQNLDSLEFPGMTTFEKELEHTRTYADIERVRFPNIRVEYEIEDAGFSLPPLTVQPLVENAIRHGVRIREEGVVRVLARKTEGGHEVVISDNGVGFDTDAVKQLDGTHIGLKNVRERIETMCGGSVTVLSRPGEGTKVTVFIPEREKEESE
jgi:LytS/YehU family sensor histidine kinase